MQARKLSEETKAFIKTLEIAEPKAFDAARDLIVWLMLDEYFEAYDVANGVDLNDYRFEVAKKIKACGHEDWIEQFKAMIKAGFEDSNPDNNESVFRSQCETLFKELVDRQTECRINLLVASDLNKKKQYTNYLMFTSMVQHIRFSFIMAQLGSALWLGKLHRFAFDVEGQSNQINNHPLFNPCLRYDFVSQPYSGLNWKDFDDLLNDVISPSETTVEGYPCYQVTEKIKEIKDAYDALLKRYQAIAARATEAREAKERRKAFPDQSQSSVNRTPSATDNATKFSHATIDCVPELADQMVLKLKHYFKGLDLTLNALEASENIKQKIEQNRAPAATMAGLLKKYPEGNDAVNSQSINQATINWKSIAKGAGFGLLTALAVVGIAAIIYFSAGAVLPALAAVLVHTVGVIGFSGAAGIAAGLGAVGAVSGGIIQWVMSPQQAKPAPVIEMDNLATPATPDEAPEERKKAAFSVKDMVKAGLASMNCLSACFEMEPALTKSSRQVPRHINPTPTPQLGASHQSPRPQSGSQ